jgi:hypothetical protein
MVARESPKLLVEVQVLYPVLVLLTQWNRVLGYEPRSRKFESCRERLTNSQEFVNI